MRCEKGVCEGVFGSVYSINTLAGVFFESWSCHTLIGILNCHASSYFWRRGGEEGRRGGGEEGRRGGGEEGKR